MKSKKYLAILLTGIFYSILARADTPGKVLMVDLNLSFTEEEHAKNSALARGDEIEIIPQLSVEQINKIKPLRSKYANYEEVMSCLKENSKNTPASCGVKTPGATVESFEADMKQLYNNIKTMVGEYDPRFKELIEESSGTGEGKKKLSLLETLKSKLKEISKESKPLNGLIISGHSSASGFGGIVGSLTKDDLTKIAEDPEAQSAMNQVKDLLLWGCYSTTTRSIRENLALFPNARLVAGFEGRGPKEDKAGDWQYLEAMLKNAKTLSEKADTEGDQAAKQKAIMSTLGQYQGMIDQMNSSFYIAGKCQENQFIYRKDKKNMNRGSLVDYNNILQSCHKPNGEDSESVTQLLSDYRSVLSKYGFCMKDNTKLVDPKTDFLIPKGNEAVVHGAPMQKAAEMITLDDPQNINRDCTVPDSGSGEVKKLYDDMNQLSFCDNPSLSVIYPDTPDDVNKSIQSILYLRLFGKFMGHWYSKYGSLINEYNQAHPEAKITIKSNSSRGEVVQEIIKFFNQNLKKDETPHDQIKPAVAAPGTKSLHKSTSATMGSSTKTSAEPGSTNAIQNATQNLKTIPIEDRIGGALNGLLNLSSSEFNLDWVI